MKLETFLRIGQRFLRKAVKEKCQYAILELTSTGDTIIITGKGAEPWIMDRRAQK
jgi:hypothetical protein